MSTRTDVFECFNVWNDEDELACGLPVTLATSLSCCGVMLASFGLHQIHRKNPVEDIHFHVLTYDCEANLMRQQHLVSLTKSNTDSSAAFNTIENSPLIKIENPELDFRTLPRHLQSLIIDHLRPNLDETQYDSRWFVFRIPSNSQITQSEADKLAEQLSRSVTNTIEALNLYSSVPSIIKISFIVYDPSPDSEKTRLRALSAASAARDDEAELTIRAFNSRPTISTANGQHFKPLVSCRIQQPIGSGRILVEFDFMAREMTVVHTENLMARHLDFTPLTLHGLSQSNLKNASFWVLNSSQLSLNMKNVRTLRWLRSLANPQRRHLDSRIVSAPSDPSAGAEAFEHPVTMSLPVLSARTLNSLSSIAPPSSEVIALSLKTHPRTFAPIILEQRLEFATLPSNPAGDKENINPTTSKHSEHPLRAAAPPTALLFHPLSWTPFTTAGGINFINKVRKARTFAQLCQAPNYTKRAALIRPVPLSSANLPTVKLITTSAHVHSKQTTASSCTAQQHTANTVSLPYLPSSLMLSLFDRTSIPVGISQMEGEESLEDFRTVDLRTGTPALPVSLLYSPAPPPPFPALLRCEPWVGALHDLTTETLAKINNYTPVITSAASTVPTSTKGPGIQALLASLDLDAKQSLSAASSVTDHALPLTINNKYEHLGSCSAAILSSLSHNPLAVNSSSASVHASVPANSSSIWQVTSRTARPTHRQAWMYPVPLFGDAGVKSTVGGMPVSLGTASSVPCWQDPYCRERIFATIAVDKMNILAQQNSKSSSNPTTTNTNSLRSQDRVISSTARDLIPAHSVLPPANAAWDLSGKCGSQSRDLTPVVEVIARLLGDGTSLDGMIARLPTNPPANATVPPHIIADLSYLLKIFTNDAKFEFLVALFKLCPPTARVILHDAIVRTRAPSPVDYVFMTEFCAAIDRQIPSLAPITQHYPFLNSTSPDPQRISELPTIGLLPWGRSQLVDNRVDKFLLPRAEMKENITPCQATSGLVDNSQQGGAIENKDSITSPIDEDIRVPFVTGPAPMISEGRAAGTAGESWKELIEQERMKEGRMR